MKGFNVEKIGPTLLLLASATLTVITTGLAVSKYISKPSQIQTSTNTSSCIVTLFGQQFDISNLRSTHSGGNIFKCGTDMTTEYQTQHGTSLARMEAFLIGTTNPTPSSSPTSSPTAPPFQKCIVTLFGTKYDVTKLRTTHSGGDIFKCSTDMTEIYQKQHGTSLDRMKVYLLNILKPTPTSTPLTQTTSSNQCIVTLFGQQFDVTKLQSTHSGGNIFTCGTDMTTVYQNKHGSSLSRMQKYLVGTNTPAPTPISTPQTQASSSTRCVVTLFNQQYDITSLQSTHSGGNIFTCGTDMTTVYQNKHGSSLSRMQKYLVGANNTTTTSSTPKPEDHEEEDDD